MKAKWKATDFALCVGQLTLTTWPELDGTFAFEVELSDGQSIYAKTGFRSTREAQDAAEKLLGVEDK